jgi:hypothetical protein
MISSQLLPSIPASVRVAIHTSISNRAVVPFSILPPVLSLHGARGQAFDEIPLQRLVANTISPFGQHDGWAVEVIDGLGAGFRLAELAILATLAALSLSFRIRPHGGRIRGSSSP